MTANTYAQLIAIIAIAACAVISFVQGWTTMGLVLLVVVVAMSF